MATIFTSEEIYAKCTEFYGIDFEETPFFKGEKKIFFDLGPQFLLSLNLVHITLPEYFTG